MKDSVKVLLGFIATAFIITGFWGILAGFPIEDREPRPHLILVSTLLLCSGCVDFLVINLTDKRSEGTITKPWDK